MSGRTAAVLSRFPRHLDAGGTGKVLGAVVGALGQGLDVQTAQVGDIRRAHRLPDAPTVLDVARLGGLHGLTPAAFEPLARRLTAVRRAVPEVAGGADPEAADEALLALVGVGSTAFARPEDAGDPAPARLRLAEALAPLLLLDAALEARRRVVSSAIARHAGGNGTPAGLLGSAAAYLGLDVRSVDHSRDRWWHLATCADLLAPAEAAAGPEGGAGDLLALEENPPRPADVDPAPRRHMERFSIVRRGLEAVAVTVTVGGLEDRTVQPMVVNLDTGSGVTFEGAVPEGGRLRFEADGRVTLDGTSVLGRAYSFRGSVFADEEAPVPTRDFLFAPDGAPAPEPPRPVEGVLADRTAYWAITHPVPDAFATGGAFPHAGGLVEPLGLARGRARWAVFVGPGTFALRRAGDGASAVQLSAPRFRAGVFDRSVFRPDPAGAPSLEVGFEWEEREAFAVRLWVPMRFQRLDAEGEATIAQRLRALLDRHRAAGIRLSVEYADPRWALGVGVLRDLASTDPRGLVVAGTTTWPAGTVQPPPS